MKKRHICRYIAAAVVVAAVLGGSISYAADYTQTTELTMTMESSYTLTVPAKTVISYGTESTSIGTVAVTGNIAGYNVVNVAASKNDFVSADNNTFSYNLNSNGAAFTDAQWTSEDIKSGKTVSLTVDIDKTTWDSVVPGEYNASIVFEASLEELQ